MDDETNETLLLLVQGKFNVPVNQRTRLQKSAVVRFWKRRDLFALGPEESPTLYFNGKKAVKTSDVSKIVGKTFKETKSAGYKKLKHRAADSEFHGFPLELYAGQAWSHYLAEMIKGGTYGDQITLQAASNLFNVQLTIHPSLGVEGNTIISPFTGVPVANFHLGHFAEGEGEHYVCLEVEDEVEDGDNEHTSEKGNDSDGENVNMMEVEVDS